MQSECSQNVVSGVPFILESRIGGSGDPRRKWEIERGRERGREREGETERGREGERESVEKCHSCLQNDLKEA